MRILVKTLLVLLVFCAGTVLAAIARGIYMSSTGNMTSGIWLFDIIFVATLFACWKVIRYKRKPEGAVSFDIDKTSSGE